MPSRFVFESSTKTSDSSLSFFDEVLAAPSSNNHQKKEGVAERNTPKKCNLLTLHFALSFVMYYLKANHW